MDIRTAVQAAKEMEKQPQQVKMVAYPTIKIVDKTVVLSSKKGEIIFDFLSRRVYDQTNKELEVHEIPNSKELKPEKSNILGWCEGYTICLSSQQRLFGALYFLCKNRPAAFDEVLMKDFEKIISSNFSVHYEVGGFVEMIDYVAANRMDCYELIKSCFGLNEFMNRHSYTWQSSLLAYIQHMFFYNCSREGTVFSKYGHNTITRIFSLSGNHDRYRIQNFCIAISSLNEDELNDLFDFAESIYNHNYGHKEFVEDVIESNKTQLCDHTFVGNRFTKTHCYNTVFVAESGPYVLMHEEIYKSNRANNFCLYVCKKDGQIYEKYATAIIAGGFYDSGNGKATEYFVLDGKPILERIAYHCHLAEKDDVLNAIMTDWRDLEWHTEFKSQIEMA